MEKRLKKNREGSVLLAVVCMTMVCMTLATISLAVVNYTTKASSRNVQRTQAKITAEACLTEFIDSYKTTGGNYDGLQSLAQGNSRSTGNKINVQMQGDSNFSTNFGECNLYVYNYSTGFKVESVCKYSTQEQTASIYFAATADTPYVPSNCIEASRWGNITGGVATPVAGSTYLEKDTSDTTLPNYLTTSNTAKYQGHIYSEYNLLFDSGTKVVDGVNKTLTTNYYHTTDYFDQASTVTVAGYLTFDNEAHITTEAGKSDINGKNSKTDPAAYDSSNLANRDGYIYTFKKLIVTFPSSAIEIGTSSKPIDTYCHGAYFGTIPTAIDGKTTEREEIFEAYDNKTLPERVGDMEFNGNFYSYLGTQAELYQNGDVVINVGAHTITINGDMFVEGDIYLCNGSSLKVTGNLYCTGKIYTAEKPETGDDRSVLSSAEAEVKNGVVSKISGAVPAVSATNYFNYIDKTVQRNIIPKIGYDPATGVDSDERKGLSVYDDCSANDMFNISINGTLTEQASTKYIATKYANAISRTLSSQYRTSTGAMADVSTPVDSNTTIINASVKLAPDECNSGTYRKRYLIKLTDQDIVIALPMAGEIVHNQWWTETTGTVIRSIFRIDRSGITSGDNYFCYFMFYDADDPTKCYYMDDDCDIITDDMNLVSLKGTDAEDDRTGKKVQFAATGNDIGINVADFSTIATALGTNDLDANFRAYPSDTADVANSGTFGLTDQECYIMYLVPDEVKFEVCDGSSPTYIQGIIYATKSDVKINGSGSSVFGQIKCEHFYPGQDLKQPSAIDCPIGDGSILGYVAQKNQTTTSIKIQYYEY